jgi:6-hydroxy-3-succinoylpyridine 3-monooxygenase
MTNAAQPVRHVRVYVDGFNLYYGLLRNPPDLKWLNLRKVAQMLFPRDQVDYVGYFTAAVDANHPSPSATHLRQQTYWNALRTLGVDIVEGRLERREKECRAHHCTHVGSRTFSAPVEKMTDVNIALRMVLDAQRHTPDAICVVSGDTDLLPAMRWLRENVKCMRRAYIPCAERDLGSRRVDEFGNNGWWTQRLAEEVLQNCILPDTVHIADDVILRPALWH